ncbi:unnamed protein product [Amoebophrya sp. A25]|nr:unnamed protein product [Amoebophrya sp. A25]|eukprot:GSA25T00007640001.1
MYPGRSSRRDMAGSLHCTDCCSEHQCPHNFVKCSGLTEVPPTTAPSSILDFGRVPLPLTLKEMKNEDADITTGTEKESSVLLQAADPDRDTPASSSSGNIALLSRRKGIQKGTGHAQQPGVECDTDTCHRGQGPRPHPNRVEEPPPRKHI